jgi:aminodeoxyfutalosine deaminase
MQGGPSFPPADGEMTETHDLVSIIEEVPKAELHLHLEGSISPETVSLLGARRGVTITAESAAARYAYTDFGGFLEAFKWATGYLKAPEDYALITHRLADELVRQRVIYAEVTVSVGVMERYGQNVEANFAAIDEVARRYRENGQLRIAWIFDATRQFGANAAMKVAVHAAKFQKQGVVAFGIGGDELSVPAVNFRAAYDYARNQGLHVTMHAGEIGGPELVRDAIDHLGAERIGHGIALMRDATLADRVANLRVPLEICLTSNLRTGALARQTGKRDAKLADHPLPQLLERGVTVVLSTDDPAMFHTDLLAEYNHAISLGLAKAQIAKIIENGFTNSFVSPEHKLPLLNQFRSSAKTLGLL